MELPDVFNPCSPYYLAIDIIFRASALLKQNPAPPVANQNEIFGCNVNINLSLFFLKKRKKFWQIFGWLPNTTTTTRKDNGVTKCIKRERERDDHDTNPSRIISIHDPQRCSNTWFAQIPVFLRIVLLQQFHQSWDVDIVVVIEMTEPPGSERKGKRRQGQSADRKEGIKIGIKFLQEWLIQNKKILTREGRSCP